MDLGLSPATRDNRIRLRIHPDAAVGFSSVNMSIHHRDDGVPRLRSALDLCNIFPSDASFFKSPSTSPPKGARQKKKTKNKKKKKHRGPSSVLESQVVSAANNGRSDAAAGPLSVSEGTPVKSPRLITQSLGLTEGLFPSSVSSPSPPPPQSPRSPKRIQQIEEYIELMTVEEEADRYLMHREREDVVEQAHVMYTEGIARFKLCVTVEPGDLSIFDMISCHFRDLEGLQREHYDTDESIGFCEILEQAARMSVLRQQRVAFFPIQSRSINSEEARMRGLWAAAALNQRRDIAIKKTLATEPVTRDVICNECHRCLRRMFVEWQELQGRNRNSTAQKRRWHEVERAFLIGPESSERSLLVCHSVAEKICLLLDEYETIHRLGIEIDSFQGEQALEQYDFQGWEYDARITVCTEEHKHWADITFGALIMLEESRRKQIRQGEYKTYRDSSWHLEHYINDITAQGFFTDDLHQFGYKKGIVSDLAKDGAFGGLRLLIGIFQPKVRQASRKVFASEWMGVMPLHETGVLEMLSARKGWTVDILRDEKEFSEKLSKDIYSVAWVLCTEETDVGLPFLTAIQQFHLKGGGLVIWGPNDPTCRACSTTTLLPKRFGFRLCGAPERDCCPTVSSEGSPLAELLFCHPEPIPEGFSRWDSCFMSGSSTSSSRVLVESGVTQVWTQYWKGGGMLKYLSNSIAWVARCSDDHYNPSEPPEDAVTSTLQLRELSHREACRRYGIAREEYLEWLHSFRFAHFPWKEQWYRCELQKAQIRSYQRYLEQAFVTDFEVVQRWAMYYDEKSQWERMVRAHLMHEGWREVTMARTKALCERENVVRCLVIQVSEEALARRELLALQEHESRALLAQDETATFGVMTQRIWIRMDSLNREGFWRNCVEEYRILLLVAGEAQQRESWKVDIAIAFFQLKCWHLTSVENIARAALIQYEHALRRLHIWPRPVCPNLRQDKAGEFLCDTGEDTCPYSHTVDKWGNPVGSHYDYARDDTFRGKKLLVGLFASSHVLEWVQSSPLSHVTDELCQRKGWGSVEVVKKEDDFLSKLCSQTYRVIWIISNNQFKGNDEEKFTQAIVSFHKRGGGIMLWGQNRNFVLQANLVLAALYGAPVFLQGQVTGKSQLTLGDAAQSGHFCKHPMTQGVLHLHEGQSMCSVSKLPKGFRVIAHGSDSVPVIIASDGEIGGCGRVIVDGCWLRLWTRHWELAGTSRYVVNATAWCAQMSPEDAYYNPGMPVRDLTWEAAGVSDLIASASTLQSKLEGEEQRKRRVLRAVHYQMVEAMQRMELMGMAWTAWETLGRKHITAQQEVNLCFLVETAVRESFTSLEAAEENGRQVLREGSLGFAFWLDTYNNHYVSLEALRRSEMEGEYRRSFAQDLVFPKPLCPEWRRTGSCAAREAFTCKFAHEVDPHGNPYGTCYDLVRGGAFGPGCRLLIGNFAPKHLPDLSQPISDLQRPGWVVDMVDDEFEFSSRLNNSSLQYRCAWIISGNALDAVAKRHLCMAVKAFHQAGGGLLLWGNKEPFVLHANAVLVTLGLPGLKLEGKSSNVMGSTDPLDGTLRGLGSTLRGSPLRGLAGDATTVTVEHPIFQGIWRFHDMGTQACATHSPSLPRHFQIINPCVIVGQRVAGGAGRIVIDAAWQRLSPLYYATSAGTVRYVANATGWIAKGSDASAYNLRVPR